MPVYHGDRPPLFTPVLNLILCVGNLTINIKSSHDSELSSASCCMSVSECYQFSGWLRRKMKSLRHHRPPHHWTPQRAGRHRWGVRMGQDRIANSRSERHVLDNGILSKASRSHHRIIHVTIRAPLILWRRIFWFRRIYSCQSLSAQGWAGEVEWLI